MLVFPGLEVGDLERIVGVTLHLLHDRYDDERPDRAPLALVSALLGGVAWSITNDPLWALGAVIMLANWPYTLLAIMPINRQLEATGSGSDRTRDRLVRWGRLHGVRSLLGAAATLTYVIAAVRGL